MPLLAHALVCLSVPFGAAESALRQVPTPQDPVAQDPPAQNPPARPVEPLPIPEAGVFRRGKARIVIDGALDDWPALPVIRLDDSRQVSGTALGAFRSLDDCAGRLFLCWDDEDLYVAARVKDDWHIRLPAEREQVNEIPPADSVLVWLDPERDTRALGNDSGRREDSAFWIAEVEGQGNRLVKWDRFRGEARFAATAAAVVAPDKQEKVTTYEARIPWAEILGVGEKPVAGQILGAQFVLSDYDDPTDPMPQTRIGWTFGMGPRIDPGLLGSLLLLDSAAEDASRSGFVLPAIPPPAVRAEPPVPEAAYWVGLANRVARQPLAWVEAGTADPSFAGGTDWRALLDELELRVAEFPRVDYVEFVHAQHRRMNRECAGLAASGLPYFWDHVLEGTVRRATAEPPEHGFVLWRLPQGGWLVRSKLASFAVDPAGFRLDHLLGAALDFVVLTSPGDPTRRNDQLLLRALARKVELPVFSHIALSLPGLEIEKFPLVMPGKDYAAQGLSIHVCGDVDEKGLVARSVGYLFRWPDGATLLFSGPELLAETVDRERPVDCHVLSALHPEARVVGQRIEAKALVIDDVLRCADLPGSGGRVRLAEAFELQKGLRPRRSTIVLPGQSVTIEAQR
ncbi:MAG: hypothetical protein IT457_01380 [Planctomycetes bacterium]|nr:hypothetical protein [Planctomycetota bacterium]